MVSQHFENKNIPYSYLIHTRHNTWGTIDNTTSEYQMEYGCAVKVKPNITF